MSPFKSDNFFKGCFHKWQNQTHSAKNWHAKHFTTFKELGRIDLCEQLIEFSDKNFGEFTEILGLDTFGPALGDFHPSRLGHQILANHITNFFDNKLKLIDWQL